METVLQQHVTKTPGVCDGRGCSAGHRIRMADNVMWHERRGYSAYEIVQFFPGLSLADVHASLAYDFDHQAELDGELAADTALGAPLSAAAYSELAEGVGG
jgi:uncharacterized protein (DUF433 family)